MLGFFYRVCMFAVLFLITRRLYKIPFGDDTRLSLMWRGAWGGFVGGFVCYSLYAFAGYAYADAAAIMATPLYVLVGMAVALFMGWLERRVEVTSGVVARSLTGGVMAGMCGLIFGAINRSVHLAFIFGAIGVGAGLMAGPSEKEE